MSVRTFRRLNTVISIIHNNRRYCGLFEYVDMTKNDILSDVIDNIHDEFRWMTETIKSIKPIKFGTYCEHIESNVNKQNMSLYYCDFSSICEIGLYIREDDISHLDVYKYRFTLDLDKKELRTYENDNRTVTPLDLKKIEKELHRALFTVLL